MGCLIGACLEISVTLSGEDDVSLDDRPTATFVTFETTFVTTFEPLFDPTFEWTFEWTYEPTFEGLFEPTFEWTFEPTFETTFEPTLEWIFEPTFEPTFETMLSLINVSSLMASDTWRPWTTLMLKNENKIFILFQICKKTIPTFCAKVELRKETFYLNDKTDIQFWLGGKVKDRRIRKILTQ